MAEASTKEKSMRSTPLVTAAVLVLGLSTVAWADRWGNDPHGDRYRDRYQDRYSDRSNSGRASDLVYEIERTAESIHRQYERNNRRPNRDEARVAVALHELQEQARRLRGQGGYRQDSRRNSREIEGLFRAFDQADASLRYIRPRPYVDQGMVRISGLLSELSRYYGVADRYGRYGDRYDRDRYDRDGYDRDRYDDRDRYRPPHN